MAEIKRPPRVAMVVTRSLSEDTSISRVRILRSIREIFESQFDTTVFRINNIIESGGLGEWIGAAGMFLTGIASRRYVPLQCALFSTSGSISELSGKILDDGYDVVYLDSVRTLGLLRSLRKRGRGIRVVVDLDDLMSRRMEMLAENHWPISLGYLRNRIPKSMRNAVEGWLSEAITKYEARALRYAEGEICRDADAVVLVSSAEKELLRKRLAPNADAELCSVIPSRRLVVREICIQQPYRFVFIGSDIHGQNKLSLEYLVRLWREKQPDTALHVYGRQVSSWPVVKNIYWHGYIEHLKDVYTDDSIALLPALRPGGIKTKMIEAWAYGRPVLANPTAFEGLEELISQGYPLVVPESAWSAYILRPEEHHDEWSRAAQIGNCFVKEELSMESYVTRWRQIMWPSDREGVCAEGGSAVADSACN